MKPIISPASTRDFFNFIYERQLIWYKRHVLKLPSPWTADPIMQKYKFCNMYRELDRCTIYLLTRLQPIKARPWQLFNIILFRFFNQDKIFEQLSGPFTRFEQTEANECKARLDKLKKSGQTIFNNAYIIAPAPGFMSKHAGIIANLKKISSQLAKLTERLDKADAPADAFIVLRGLPQVGPFLAGEIWTDLSYLKFFKQNWTDDDFTTVGPGALWGLKILSGLSRLSPVRQNEILQYLHQAQRKILPKIFSDVTDNLNWNDIAYRPAFSNAPWLSLTNIEGALCEFRKYTNLKNGHGRRRYFKNN